MSDKTQIQVTNNALQLDRNYIANENGDMVNERGEVCGSVDYETGKVKIRFSLNCDERPEWLDSDNKQLLGDIDMTLNCGDSFIPTNPITNEPYFEMRDDAWSGEWVAGEVKPIPNSEFGGDDD